MILKAVVNFLWFDIDYNSIQWLIKMNINSCVNKVWTERVDNKFRQQFDKVLETYQATMHSALCRHPLFSPPYYFSLRVSVVVVFFFFMYFSLSHTISLFLLSSSSSLSSCLFFFFFIHIHTPTHSSLFFFFINFYYLYTRV